MRERERERRERRTKQDNERKRSRIRQVWHKARSATMIRPSSPPASMRNARSIWPFLVSSSRVSIPVIVLVLVLVLVHYSLLSALLLVPCALLREIREIRPDQLDRERTRGPKGENVLGRMNKRDGKRKLKSSWGKAGKSTRFRSGLRKRTARSVERCSAR